jgi:hypothetical protein
MAAEPARTSKRLLILGDHHCLAKAVAADLGTLGETTTVVYATTDSVPQAPVENDGFDLIVMAMGLPYSEPLVALARASLSEAAGRVPILIVSDRHFRTDAEARISHLDYPCSATELRQAAEKLLNGVGTQPMAQAADHLREDADRGVASELRERLAGA